MGGTLSPFVFVVTDLLREGGRSRDVHISTPLEIGVELSRTSLDRPLTADIRLTATSGGIMVRGDVRMTVRQTCSRCLNAWSEDSAVSFNELFSLHPVADVDYSLDGDSIDLEQVIRDEVALSFPLRPQCSETCEGLGAAAESYLNTSASGEAGEFDSPFAVLRDLLEPGE